MNTNAVKYSGRASTHKPFNAQEDTGVPFHRNINSILRRDHQKNFLWASRLWVGRQKAHILGYVPKNDKKKEFGP